MISANNVTLRFGKKALFEDVSIKFTEGNCYGIIGANGAGKSTFLKILSGDIEPTKGHVYIDPKCRMSVLRQDQNMYDDYSVMETVIMGNPNAGKSSLLNVLLNEDRAIVTDIPGTTRDTLTERVRIGDAMLVLTDTAGIRETTDLIENMGISAAKKSAQNADLILYLMDTTTDASIDDETLIELLRDKPAIFLLNKNDLTPIEVDDSNDGITYDSQKLQDFLDEKGIKPSAVIHTSMVTGEGIDELKKVINELFYDESLMSDDQVIITNLRHVERLREARRALDNVRAGIGSGVSQDLYCIDLTDAYRALAAITGAEVNESIVNEIFSKFCMGK